LNKTRSPKKIDSDDNASSSGFPVVLYSDSDEDRKEKRKRPRSENISDKSPESKASKLDATATFTPTVLRKKQTQSSLFNQPNNGEEKALPVNDESREGIKFRMLSGVKNDKGSLELSTTNTLKSGLKSKIRGFSIGPMKKKAKNSVTTQQVVTDRLSPEDSKTKLLNLDTISPDEIPLPTDHKTSWTEPDVSLPSEGIEDTASIPLPNEVSHEPLISSIDMAIIPLPGETIPSNNLSSTPKSVPQSLDKTSDVECVDNIALPIQNLTNPSKSPEAPSPTTPFERNSLIETEPSSESISASVHNNEDQNEVEITEVKLAKENNVLIEPDTILNPEPVTLKPTGVKQNPIKINLKANFGMLQQKLRHEHTVTEEGEEAEFIKRF